MLLIVMHNKRDYLEALSTLAREKGIIDTSIIEQKDIGLRVFGDRATLSFHKGCLTNEYDKAFISVIKDEKKIQSLLDMIENDINLNALNSDDKGFICSVPFNEINFLGLGARKNQAEKIGINLSEYLLKERIIVDLKSTKKEDSINEIASCLRNSREVNDFDDLLKEVFKREELFTTGIGNEIAIPHARTNAVNRFVMVIGKSNHGVEFNAIDKKPVNLIFLLVVPEKDKNHVKYLAHLNRMLSIESFKKSLMNAQNEEEIIRLFEKFEK